MREQNQTKRCKWQPRQEEYFITCSLPQTSTPSPFGSHPIPLSPRRARLIPCPEFVVSIYVREPQVRAANNIVNPIPNSEDAKMFCFNCPHQPSRGGNSKRGSKRSRCHGTNQRGGVPRERGRGDWARRVGPRNTGPAPGAYRMRASYLLCTHYVCIVMLYSKHKETQSGGCGYRHRLTLERKGDDVPDLTHYGDVRDLRSGNVPGMASSTTSHNIQSRQHIVGKAMWSSS